MKINKISTISFCIIMSLIFFVNIFMPIVDFSENENRFLAKMPKLTFENVISGEFMKDFEKYSTDQFMFRDFWVSLKAAIEKALGKKENNGVYISKNNYLIEKPNKYDENIINNNFNSLIKLSDSKDINLSLCLIPTAFEINKDMLPLGAYDNTEQNILDEANTIYKNSNVNLINPYDKLNENKSEYLYYKTDHHQTSLGSYYTYVKICENLGISPLKISEFEITKVSDSFYGSTWSKAMINSIKPDDINIFYPKNDIEFNVSYVSENRETNSLYELDNLSIKDKYTVFLDGNHSLVTIDSSLKNGKEIAIFKDSYAHSIVPFLANHYEKIHILDLRYINSDPLSYLEQNEISDVLIIYNIKNFMTDLNIPKLSAFIK